MDLGKNMEFKNISKDGTSFSFISQDIIKEAFWGMTKEGKSSLVFKENPVVYFINLPEKYEGTEEVHENDDDVLYVFEGEADLLVNGNDLKIKAGDFVHVPFKTNHKIKYTEKGIKYIVYKIKRT